MWRHMVKTLWQGILTANEDSSEELVDDKHILFVKSFTGEFCSDGTNTHRYASEPRHHATTSSTHKVNKVLRPPHKEAAMPAIASVYAKFIRRFSALKLPSLQQKTNWTLAQKHSLMRSLKSCWQVLLSSKKTLHEFSWPFKKRCQNIWQTSRGSWGSCLENLWTVSSMNEKEVCCLANLIP